MCQIMEVSEGTIQLVDLEYSRALEDPDVDRSSNDKTGMQVAMPNAPSF